MNMRKIFKTHVLLIVCLLISSQFVFAAGIKERMKARLPVIHELKTQGIIGETSNGYLGFVGDKKASEGVIAAENKDRSAIYKHFAKQQKTIVDVVEKVQGKRKAQKVKPGQYYQTPDGAWVKK